MRKYAFVDFATQLYNLAVLLLILGFHNSTVPHWEGLVALQLALLVAVHCLVCAAPVTGTAWRNLTPGKRVLDVLRHFYPVLLFTLLFMETSWVNRMFFPKLLDATLLRWEQAVFGFQPSLQFMKALPFLPVSEMFYAAYFSYYVMIAGVGLALFVRNRTHFFHYISVVSFIFYVCYLLYIIFPVAGPPVLFWQAGSAQIPAEFVQAAAQAPFPPNVTAGPVCRLMAWVYQTFESPGAAIPSSHVAIALTTVYFSFRYLRKLRWPHLVLALLLCLGTVYCRYHYALDVLTGALTAALLVPVGNWLYHRSCRGENLATSEAAPAGTKQN